MRIRFRNFFNGRNNRGIALYKEGWAELVNQGFHLPVQNLSIEDHHVVIMQNVTKSETDIGIATFYENDMVKNEAIVMMFYIKPEYRGKGLAKRLFFSTVDKALDIGCPHISFGVHKNNRVMRHIMNTSGSLPQFISYEYRHPQNLDLFGD